MSISTDWLIAPCDDAEAVAAIVTTEEHSFDDWPHLNLSGIGQLELEELARVVCGDEQPALGDLLFHGSDEGPFVAPLADGFVERLAATTESALGELASAWRRSQQLADWPLPEIEKVLRDVVAFARQARAAQTPILQLMTL